MIAVDTNILVYAHRVDSEWHSAADTCFTRIAESGSPWAIPWPCIHEFLAVVTHPRIFDPPTAIDTALDEIEHWFACPSLAVLGEVAGYWPHFRDLVIAGKVAGPKVHEGRIAALCQLHGVTELWSADRDFSRFPAIKVRNPLRSI